MPTEAAVETLPAEIIDDILKYFHDDRWKAPFHVNCEAKPSLRACTLVCRRWRELAQAHLYRGVYYSFMEDDNDGGRATAGIPGSRWCAYPNGNICRPVKTLAMFLAFLARSPRIASYIYHLVLDAHAHSDTTHHWMYTENHGVCVSILSKVVHILPHLKDLYLRDVLVRPSLDFVSPSDRPSESLRQLHIICDGSFHHSVDISCILSCFRRIGTLRLVFPGLTRTVAGTVTDCEVTNVLLDANDHRIDTLIETLYGSLRTDSVRGMTVIGVTVWRYQSLIDKLSPGLEELTYHFPSRLLWDYDPDEVRAHFSGQMFPRLRVLRLSLTLTLTNAVSLQRQLKAAACFLADAGVSPAAQPALSELGLNLCFHAQTNRPYVNAVRRKTLAPELDRALVGLVRDFALQKVVIRWLVGKEPLREDRECWVRDVLPALREHDMLEFRGVVGGVAPGVVSRVFPYEPFVEYIS